MSTGASRASCATMITQPPCSRLSHASRHVPGLHIGCASNQVPLLPQWASWGGAVYAASFTLGFLPWYLAWYCLFLPRECMFSNFNLKGDIWLSGRDSSPSRRAVSMIQLLDSGRSSICHPSFEHEPQLTELMQQPHTYPTDVMSAYGSRPKIDCAAMQMALNPKPRVQGRRRGSETVAEAEAEYCSPSVSSSSAPRPPLEKLCTGRERPRVGAPG